VGHTPPVTLHLHSGPRQALPILSAVAAVLAHPERLVRVLAAADDDEAAVAALASEFDLEPDQARAVLDQQFRLLTRAGRAALGAEVRVLEAEWGEPIAASVVLYGNRGGLLAVEGSEYHLSGRNVAGVLEAAAGQLREAVAVPRMAPVRVAVSGTQVAEMTVWPTGAASFTSA
jgi:hypothetical protein